MNPFIVGLVIFAPTPSDAFALIAIVLVIWLLLVRAEPRAQSAAGGKDHLTRQHIDRELRSQYKAKRRRR
jgi:hypothetical protein